ncbi:MAG: glycosyltransferase family 4 protein [Candidatus Nezhaarchaeota archaeon]|nr:glycosyltransferase family 4 protein [Candidatus Nezhaarchaeota archaeon]
MRICFITSEVFLGRRRGGFGKLVRIVGRELARRGFDVSVVCWRGPGENPPTEVDGIEVLSYPYDFTSRSSFKHAINYARAIPLIKRADADVYVSIDCMVETYLAQKVMPDRKHVIWVQDPFDENDYKLLGSVDPNYRVNKLKFLATVKLYEKAYNRADVILTQARYYIPKIARLYRADLRKVVYLPNPVEYIPSESSIVKSKEPMVCFLGRMDPQKRYWLFFRLAKALPEVKFIAMGRPGPLYEKMYERIVRKYQGLKNLEIAGFVSEDEKSRKLSESWVFCLPSIREGLPISFLEALAHKNALLSSVNPDNFVKRFGYYVINGNFVKGLKELLSNSKWRKLGEAGYRRVNNINSPEGVVDRLIKSLQGVLG